MIHSTEFSKCKQTYDVSYLRPECSLSLSLSLSLYLSFTFSFNVSFGRCGLPSIHISRISDYQVLMFVLPTN